MWTFFTPVGALCSDRKMHSGTFCRQIVATLFLWDFWERRSEPRFQLYTSNKNYHHIKKWKIYDAVEYKFVIEHDLFQGKNYMQELTIDVTEMDSKNFDSRKNDRILNKKLRWRPESPNTYFRMWNYSEEGKVDFRLRLRSP